jgi:enamine deaminase RidA (YjgF/YER057c/UK114 family)
VGANPVAAEMSVADIVKMKIDIVGECVLGERRTAIAAFLGDHLPAMTVVSGATLGAPEMLVEVEVTEAQ